MTLLLLKSRQNEEHQRFCAGKHHRGAQVRRLDAPASGPIKITMSGFDLKYQCSSFIIPPSCKCPSFSPQCALLLDPYARRRRRDRRSPLRISISLAPAPARRAALPQRLVTFKSVCMGPRYLDRAGIFSCVPRAPGLVFSKVYLQGSSAPSRQSLRKRSQPFPVFDWSHGIYF